jgi:hypothetical protein
MVRPACIALLLTALLAAPWPARAEDPRKVAAEHFSLGEAAEKRQDWRAAIAEFKLAYEAQPHPAPLFKIARNYERLEEWRSAVEYYQRYLDESPDARDRDKVAAKIEALQKNVEAEAPRPQATEGLLVVQSNVDGAHVAVDGQVLGDTPFEQAVPAGPHRVDVTLDGYAAVQRDVRIPAGGSEQIRALLIAAAVEPEHRGGWLIGVAYGFDFTQTSGRYVISFGVRFPGERLETEAEYGAYGPNDVGLGVGARLYFSLGKLRPYLRVLGTIGRSTSGSTDARTFGLEGGAGLLFATFSNLRPGQRGSVEYYVELTSRYTMGGFDDDADTGNDVATFLLPLQAGIVFRFK